MSINRGMRFLGVNTEPLEAGDVTARFDPGTAFTDDDGSQKGVPEDAEAVPLIGRDRQVDVSILDEFKRQLKIELIKQLGLPVKCVFKDYDPECELAVTVILLSRPLPKE